MTPRSEMSSEELAKRIAAIVDEKGGRDVVALDVHELVGYTDFLVICTARNERQAKAITDEVKLQLKREEQLLPSGVEGDGPAGWVVLDYLDCKIGRASCRERV